MKVYHGSDVCVSAPSLERGRIDTDFGMGFYVAADFDMAERWACRKKKPVITEYDLELDGLEIYEFSLDKEWLDFVIANRNMENPDFDVEKYDVLIGATADDKLFATIEQYESGLISTGTAIEALNCMRVGTQICIKTLKALGHLQFTTEMHPNHGRIMAVREKNTVERKRAAVLTADIIRRNNRQPGEARMGITAQQEEKERD